MAHHSSEFDEEIDKMTTEAAIRFGATGRFPEGKISKLDEGEICFGITADQKTKTVLLNFGTPVVWLGLTPDQAIDICNSLRDKAMELKTIAGPTS